MRAEELECELPKGLVNWIRFKKGDRVLFISTASDFEKILQESLVELGVELDTVLYCGDGGIPDKRYKYILIANLLEKRNEQNKVPDILKSAMERLDNCGKLLLFVRNRLGIRYLCGDQDPYTHCVFDGIDGYARLNEYEQSKLEGRLLSKADLLDVLNQAQINNHKFYSVFPVIERPQLIIAEDYIPNEELDIRIFPQYDSPKTIFVQEEKVYQELIRNELLHTLSNGFIVECSCSNGDFMPVNQVTVSMDRGFEHALCTIIRTDGVVEKRAMYELGNKKHIQLIENSQYLTEHKVQMVASYIEDGSLRMPYIKGVSATTYLRQLLMNDVDAFLIKLDEWWNIILFSSEHVAYEEIAWEAFEPGWEKRKEDDPNKEKWKSIAFGTLQMRENLGVILERGYLDLVSHNCFYVDHCFMFYDQELYLEKIPAKSIMLRTIDFIYSENGKMEQYLPKQEVLKRYKIDQYIDLFYKFISKYLNELRNDKPLEIYHKKVRPDYLKIMENRIRMNYSEEEYHTIFRDIFRHTYGRKLYLFGAGIYAKIFRERYNELYPITGYIDNNSSKWGTIVDGLPVYNPSVINTMAASEYKIIISMLNFQPTIEQLQEMGVSNFSVFNAKLFYKDKLIPQLPMEKVNLEHSFQSAEPKKYNIGYIAGVFDLFHMGHLNILKKAKEHCNYLIVGVVTDEGVIRHKKSNPIIPFSERVEILKSCKFVDAVVEIPLDNADTEEAYRRYQFDVQFSGSDYENDPEWIQKRNYLRQQGADLVFFQYTDSVSSTTIKKMINKKLL